MTFTGKTVGTNNKKLDGNFLCAVTSEEKCNIRKNINFQSDDHDSKNDPIDTDRQFTKLSLQVLSTIVFNREAKKN